jgi:hypothetical protein
LKYQTEKDFTFVWLFSEGCKFERYRAKMLKAAGIDFQFFEPGQSELRTEIECDPACFLSSNTVAQTKTMQMDYYLGGSDKSDAVFSSGFVHENGKTLICDRKCDSVSCSFHVKPMNEFQQSYVVVENPAWIIVRHSLSLSPMSSGVLRKPTKVDWPGWDPALVNRYVATRMATGTSKGSTLEPYKSKSLIRVRHPGKVPRGRRRRDDIAE